MSPQKRTSGRSFTAALIRIYKSLLAPFLGGDCRYFPSCSDYFDEAVAKNGFLKGAALGAWRILRCHPFSSGGWDPVPGNMEQGD